MNERPADPARNPVLELAEVPARPPRSDLALALALLLWGVLEVLLGPSGAPTALALLWAAGFSLPLAFRRRWPVQALALITLIALWRAATGNNPEEGAMPMPSVLIGAFSAALYARPRWITPLGIILPVVAIAGGLPRAETGSVDYVILIFIVALAWLAGWLLRRRAEQLATAQLEGPELARAAVLAERQRMARELHDVVAHSVSIISVQAGAAEQQLELDPERARQHISAVRETSREAMTELRRLVGLLREDDPSYVPAPGLSRLPDLVEQAESAGHPVTLELLGEQRGLAAGLDLTAYRVVQESLTNTRKHASGSNVSIVVDYGESDLTICVVDSGGRASGEGGGGRGLIGMHERVRLYGGGLSAGPVEGGGFEVRAALPYGDRG